MMEGMAMLLPWFRVDRIVGDFIEPRWFQWGYVTRYSGGEPFAWYILIKLPSYVMQSPLSWGEDAPPTWHQRVLLFRERLPGNGKWGDGKWQMTEFECP